MKINNPFFKKEEYINLDVILNLFNIKNSNTNIKINNICDLVNAKKNDISFFNSLKYSQFLKKTKAAYVIVNKKHVDIVKNYFISNPELKKKNPFLEKILIEKEQGEKFQQFLQENCLSSHAWIYSNKNI